MKKSITKNYIYNMIYQVLTLILPLITTPYLSRVLGAEGIGIYGYTYSIVTYFILFGSLGVALYGQREIAYAQENVESRKKIFFEIVIFRFITIAIASIFYYFLFINGANYQVYYRILLFELIAAGFDISWFFQGLEEFKRTVTRNVLVRICSVTLVFILVKTKEDLAKFTLIYSIADLVGNLSLWLYLPKYLAGVKIKNINITRHIPAIMLLFIPQIANQIYKILDTTMIGKIVADKSETGFYEQAQKVIRLLLTVVTSLGTVMIPRMANTFANGDKEQINKYMKMSFRFVFFLSFPIMFGIMSIAQYFVPVFFGQGYEKVVTLICIISPIILLMGIANVVGTQYLLPTKKQKEYTISVFVGIIVNFIMNYIMIHLWGAIGASVATVLSQLVVDIMQIHYVRKEIEVFDMLKMSWNYLKAGIIMFAACLVANVIINRIYVEKTYFINCISIIVEMVIGVIMYFSMLMVEKDPYLYTFLEKIKNRIKVSNKMENE